MAQSNIKKNASGYGYKYTDLAEIHNYLESINASYYQWTETDSNGVDYIWTTPIIDGKEEPPRRGCRVIQASLSGKSNPAQEQGSGLTYARRYSLLMAFGLATTDDDAAVFTKKEEQNKKDINEDAPMFAGGINRKQINAIMMELDRTGISESSILEYAKKKSITEFTQEDYAKVTRRLSKTETKGE